MNTTRALRSPSYLIWTRHQCLGLLNLTVGFLVAQSAHGFEGGPLAPPAQTPPPLRIESKPDSPKLPSLPLGVTELKFSEFFVHPAGPRGLEFTDKLRQLDGQRVRILGYMVKEQSAPPGTCLLTPIPVELHEHDDHCFIDDLPASRVTVISPTHRDKPIAYNPGLLLLTGTLSVGNRAEADGRSSIVRLTLESPEPALKPGSTPPKEANRLLRVAPARGHTTR